MNLRLHFFKKSNLFKVSLSLMTLLSLNASAQLLHSEAVTYRTGFLNNYYSNPDSAIIYARKLSLDIEYASFLRQAIHEDLFYWFTDEVKQRFKDQGLKNNDPDWRKKYHEFLMPICSTLYKMSIDSNLLLTSTSKPIYLWANVHMIQQNIDDAKELKKSGKNVIHSSAKEKAGPAIQSPGNLSDFAKTKQFVQAFITAETAQKDLYQDKMGTYALLMYKDIVHDKNLQKPADGLLSATMKASLGAVQNIDVNTASNNILKRRAWNRYIYATANYFKANTLAQAGENKAATAYYKTAAEYSPDLTDLSNPLEFSTEVHLFGNKRNELFQSAYLTHLKKFVDREQMLSTITEMALRNPVDHKAELSSYYAANFLQRESFNTYWRKAINKGLTKAPVFQIQRIDGSNYSSAEKAGKWILVDFWGTWCGPCRIEHPALQQLYLKSNSVPSAYLDIITIACNDTKEKVNHYMSEFKYTYPVAIDDQKITKAYNVRGYPTKALITPEGNYMFIPFNSDWVKFIERYTED